MATMLDCKTVQPQISEYIDGAVDSADAAWAIKLHLSSCAVCTQVAEDLTQTTRLLQSLPAMDTSPAFEAALARRLADQVLQPRRPSMLDGIRDWWAGLPSYRTAFASAAALAAVVPAGLVVAYHVGSTHPARVAPSSKSVKTTADPALDELFNEHMSYASSEPLADSSAAMLETPGASAASAASSPSSQQTL